MQRRAEAVGTGAVGMRAVGMEAVGMEAVGMQAVGTALPMAAGPETAGAGSGEPSRAGLVAHLGEIVSVVAADGRVLHVNHGSRPGEPGQERGRDVLGWVHPDDHPVVRAAFAELLADPRARTRTCVRVRRAGQAYRHMETTGLNRLADPDVGGLVFVSRDVEDRVQLEQTAARSLQAQRLVAALGVDVLVGGELDPLLASALADTAGLLGAQYLTLLEHDATGTLRVTRMHGERPLPAGAPLPRGAGVRVAEFRERGVLATAEARLEGPRGAVGVLVAAWVDEHVFDETQRQLLQGVANVLAGARQRERREEAAVVRALHDPLTGLPTRPLLLDRLDHALARAAREGTGVAVLLVDLDRFKEVNDRFGHAAGDAVLRELGARLAACVRPGDTAARLGGDEFVVLCEDVGDAGTVAELCARVRQVFAAPFAAPDGGALVLTGSVGSAVSGSGRSGGPQQDGGPEQDGGEQGGPEQGGPEQDGPQVGSQDDSERDGPRRGSERDALLDAADLAMYRDKRRRSS